MDPSGIPEESQHEFIVKEEFVIEDVPYIDCEPISEKPKDSFLHKTKSKCGEIMLNNPGEFILVCALCRRSSFTDLHTFGMHIQKVHLNLAGDIGNIVPKEESQSLETDNISDSTLQDTANIYVCQSLVLGGLQIETCLVCSRTTKKIIQRGLFARQIRKRR